MARSCCNSFSTKGPTRITCSVNPQNSLCTVMEAHWFRLYFFLTTGLDCSCKATEEHVRYTPGQLANAILKDVEKREEAGRGGWRPNSTRYISRQTKPKRRSQITLQVQPQGLHGAKSGKSSKKDHDSNN